MNRIALMVLRNIHKVPAAYSKLCRYAKNPEQYTETEMYGHIQYILQEAINGGNVNVEVHGKENIPAENGFLLTSNHQGMFDVLAIAVSCHLPLSVVYKKELKKVPVLEEIYRCTNSYAMDRENVRQSLGVIQNVTEQVQKGRRYVIFPEGTRSKKGNEMNEFHAGSFRCAMKAKCPIVPMAFIDSFKALDQKGSDPITVQLHYLQPILYDEYKNLKTAQLAALVKSRIQQAINDGL